MSNNCNNQFLKSLLTIYNDENQTLANGVPATFTKIYVDDGVSISTPLTNNTSSTTIYLNKKGRYLVQFNAVAVENGTAGEVAMQVYRNGVAVPSAYSASYSTSTTDSRAISSQTIIEVNNVCPCCGNGVDKIPLTFVNVGVDAIYSYVSVTIIKLA